MFKQNKALTVSGWVLTILLTVLFIGPSATLGKFMKPMNAEMAAERVKLGLPDDVIFNLGIVEVTCAVLFIIPQTSVLGAVLLTGYLGGAVATHVRLGDPMGKVLAPAIIGAVVWLALFLRDPRIRALLPFRSAPPATEIKL